MVLMGGHGASGQEIEAALAYLLRDQLRAALQKTLSERRAGKCAPPKAEREQLLAQMEAEIAALKRKEEDLLGDFRALQKEVEG
jgi:hypothetical protein